MNDRIVLKYAELPRPLRKPLWRFWHNLMNGYERNDVSITCLNYGYAAMGDSPETIALPPEHERERYPVQLYHRAVGDGDLAGKRVLEVGCGRGGGASFLAKHFMPAEYIGLDLAPRNIRFCNEYHGTDNLRFVKGDAENLPFEDDTFDAVVNVESSRCYGDIPRFFREVRRVLTTDGRFHFVDMRWKEDLPLLREQLQEAGFAVDSEANITENVVRSLDLDDERRRTAIDRKVPRFLNKAFGEFAGVRGSGRYNEFADGRMQYVAMSLRPAGR